MTGFCKEIEEARPIRRALSPGVYTPLPTFFDDDEELDLDSYRKHLLGEFSKYEWDFAAGQC